MPASDGASGLIKSCTSRLPELLRKSTPEPGQSEGSPTRRSLDGRVECDPGGSSVREVLHRGRYRGEVVYNKTRRRGADGARATRSGPTRNGSGSRGPTFASSLRRHGAPPTRPQLDGTFRHVRRRDAESPYLLSGFSRCAECGRSIGVLDRRRYGCIAYHKRRTTVCRNAVKLPIATLDAAVLRALTREALRPAVERAIVEGLLAGTRPAHGREGSRAPAQSLRRSIGNRPAHRGDRHGRAASPR